ncbi:MAG: Sua5/YciO/YrdC/YwlC family protein [bacterium]|jgi:L-threonylcarbamoyladenylate synthase
MIAEIINELKSKKIVGISTDDAYYTLIDSKDESYSEKFQFSKYEDASREILIDNINKIESYISEINPMVYDLVEFSEKPMLLILPNSMLISPNWRNADGNIGIRAENNQPLNRILNQYKIALVKIKTDEALEDVKYFDLNYIEEDKTIISLEPNGKIIILQK